MPTAPTNSPQTPQNSAEFLRPYPRRYARYAEPFGIEGNLSTLSTTANYSLLTANSSYTFSAKEKDVETGLSYFGSRYYSSDLCIWLSVDPQSDKYASLSPYVYCANNPVKLVDPNGEEWLRKEDKEYAESLISTAQNRQKMYEATSREYKLLQEGIDGLKDMGKQDGQKYTFNKTSSTQGNVSLLDDGTISINYIEREDNADVKDGSAWHEAFHLTRRNEFMKLSQEERENAATTYWGFNSNKRLSNNNNCNEEYIAFWAQLSFSPKSMPYNSTGQISDVGGIQLYVENKYPGCKLHKFRLPITKPRHQK